MPNNPPAFPACNEANNNDTMGKALLDYFAGQALTGVLARQTPVTLCDLPAFSYDIAQAMLTERARRGGDDDA